MAEIKPFCAWRYNPDRVELAEAIAPPYDVIDAGEQDRLYGKSPFNIVRVILTKDHAERPGESENKYERARAHLRTWQHDRILQQDQQPAFYLYRQTYKHPDTGKPVQRTGFFGLIKLEEFSKKIVLPHERTHTGPKVDRMQLIRAVQGNLSPVFGLYEDAAHALDAVFASVMQTAAIISIEDDQDMKHEVWRMEKTADIGRLRDFFKTQSIMIADGHHRYETALTYRDAVRKENPDAPAGTLSSDYVLMTFVNMYDAGLLVFPTHRLLALPKVPSAAELQKKLGGCFEIRPVTFKKAAEWERAFQEIPKNTPAFGIIMHSNFLLTLKDKQSVRALMPTGKPDPWFRLDVAIVSHAIIEKTLGISHERFEKVVNYTRHLDEALEQVKNGTVSVGILMRAPEVAIVKEVCYSGEVMPQKSTYFYPKLPSGLLLHLHERS